MKMKYTSLKKCYKLINKEERTSIQYIKCEDNILTATNGYQLIQVGADICIEENVNIPSVFYIHIVQASVILSNPIYKKLDMVEIKEGEYITECPNFPNVEQAIPKTYENKISFTKEELKKLVEAMDKDAVITFCMNGELNAIRYIVDYNHSGVIMPARINRDDTLELFIKKSEENEVK